MGENCVGIVTSGNDHSSVTCVICGTATGVARRLELAGGGCYECRGCGLAFFAPLPSRVSMSSGDHSVETAEAYTQGMIESAAAPRSALTPGRCRNMAKLRHDAYRQLLGRSEYSLLEVGCGAAELGTAFVKLGVGYSGIDIDERCVTAARARGLGDAVARMDVFDLQAGRTFDVICFSQVLEHMIDPVGFVRHVHRHLNDGGVVHGDVPNHDGLASVASRIRRDTRGDRWGAIEYPHHLFAYRRHTLQRLLRPCFDVDVFGTVSGDACWGQPRSVETGARGAVYYALARLLGMPNLLVFVGKRLEPCLERITKASSSVPNKRVQTDAAPQHRTLSSEGRRRARRR